MKQRSAVPFALTLFAAAAPAHAAISFTKRQAFVDQCKGG
jgi:hypothetical protein